MPTLKLTFRSPIYQPRGIEQAFQDHGITVHGPIPFESKEVDVEGDAQAVLQIRNKLRTLFYNTFYKAETVSE